MIYMTKFNFSSQQQKQRIITIKINDKHKATQKEEKKNVNLYVKMSINIVNFRNGARNYLPDEQANIKLSTSIGRSWRDCSSNCNSIVSLNKA